VSAKCLMRYRQRIVALLLSGFLLVPAAKEARAEGSSESEANPVADLTIEQLLDVRVESVYSASRYEQKVTQAPSAVSIVTSDEIKRFGHRTLADVLRSVRGLYVSDDRNYSYIGMRGFQRPGDYNSRVLLLVDGHRLNENVYDSAYYGHDAAIDVDLIERVEVTRGPSSSIYGNSAFFGVINLVTKPGSRVDGLELSSSVASYDSYSGSVTYGKKFKNDVDLLVSGSIYHSAGDRRLHYPEFQDINNGVAENSDDERSYRAFAKLSYHDLTLSGGFGTRIKDVPTASFSTVFNDGREKTTDNRGFVDLKFEREIGLDLNVLARVSYDHYSYYGDYPYDYPPVVLYKDEALGDWLGTEVQLTKRFADRHTVVAGIDYRENLRQSQHASDPYGVVFDDDRSSRSVGVYAQGEVAILTNLTLNAGVRYDYFSYFDDSINPRAGIIFNPRPNSALKLLYGRAFRAPNVYELYYGQIGNPNLEPETIDTYEAVYEHYFLKHYRVSVSGFFYNIDGLIQQVEKTNSSGRRSFTFQNVEEASAKGLELELEAKYPSGVLLRGSYVLQQAEDHEGRILSNSPRHLAKFNFSVPIYRDKVFTSLELQYHGRVKTLTRNTADDFVLANFTLFSRELVKGLELSAGVHNLLDTKYGYPGAEDHLQDVIQQNGRTFFGKLTYKF
jgi:outer membrane receptor for ferrienterochelin and colicins